MPRVFLSAGPRAVVNMPHKPQHMKAHVYAHSSPYPHSLPTPPFPPILVQENYTCMTATNEYGSGQFCS